MRTIAVVAILATAAMAIVSEGAQRCGWQAGGATCRDCQCCSQFGWCGTTMDHCGIGCQSQCFGCRGGSKPSNPPTNSGSVSSIVPRALFERMLLHRNDSACQAKGFYTYDAFIAVANSFPGFGAIGGADVQKREVAAFLAQTSHETTGGWATAPDGPYAWGYCFKQELGATSDYCTPSVQWPCTPGKKYYGRGPIQLSHNYNYGPAGRAIGVDLLENPDLVASDPIVAFKTAMWFWMTPQAPKPSSHAVSTGQWSPSAADAAAGRMPGFGVITNIINGGIECGHGQDSHVADRIGFYKRYCDILGVGYGDNLDCYNQKPFA
uniref:Uncharacterized protein n=1 Tax=Avena sativa TaxID=4498 RepID=A0ACD5UJA5_AVESA